MQRKAFLLIIGVGIISLLLFVINAWLRDEGKGVLLTQDSYMGTITWYEDSETPPIPSEFSRENALIAKGDIPNSTIKTLPKQEIVKEFESMNLDIATAAGPEKTESVVEKNSNEDSPIKKLPQPAEDMQEEKIAGIIEEPKSISTKRKDVVAVNTQNTSTKTTTPPSSAKKTLERVFLTQQKDFPIIIKVNTAVTYNSFYLAGPDRLVVDLVGKFVMNSEESILLPKNPYVKAVRVAYNGENTRIVFDLLKKPKAWATKHLSNKAEIGISL